jgi:hypothetical protein
MQVRAVADMCDIFFLERNTYKRFWPGVSTISANGTRAKATLLPGKCLMSSDKLICKVLKATSGMALNASGRTPSAGPGSAAIAARPLVGETQPDAPLVVVRAGLGQVVLGDQPVNELAARRLVHAEPSRQFGYADIGRFLHFLEQPHLRPRKAATLLHLAEVLAHAAVDHAELLQNIQGQAFLFEDCRGIGDLLQTKASIILQSNVVFRINAGTLLRGL